MPPAPNPVPVYIDYNGGIDEDGRLSDSWFKYDFYDLYYLIKRIFRIGYYLVGWATTADATEPDITYETHINDGTTIYAVWKPGYDLSSISPIAISTGDVLNVPYSGKMVCIELEKGTYKLECWGAQGGFSEGPSYGGMGGYSVGTLKLENKSPVYIYAGGAGNRSHYSGYYYTRNYLTGGFNGGGLRNTYPGGGGSSDVRIGSCSRYARIIVAGGGGSQGNTQASPSPNAGGGGGGTTGIDGSGNTGSTDTVYGYAGTQTGNNANRTTSSQYTYTDFPATALPGFGFGGNGYNEYGGAGGSGWYGGMGGYAADTTSGNSVGGGGGSGYVYTSSTASDYPSGCLLDSSMYLSDAKTVAGNISFTAPSGLTETGHFGDGYVRITVIETEKGSNSSKIYMKKNGIWQIVG